MRELNPRFFRVKEASFRLTNRPKDPLRRNVVKPMRRFDSIFVKFGRAPGSRTPRLLLPKQASLQRDSCPMVAQQGLEPWPGAL